MGREVKRVPVDFDWPLGKIWKGFVTPEKFGEDACPSDCEGGSSWQASRLHSLWYGYLPFTPEMNGSTPFTTDTPAIRGRAERNLEHAPEHYGTGETALLREARRLAQVFNSSWCYHLSDADVDTLLEADRLWEFTRKIEPGKGWVPLDNPVRPTAAQVNEWSIATFGHDGINSSVVIRGRCDRYGTPTTCEACQGHGSVEAYPGQREEREAWEWEYPPEGDGYQLWETVSEGSPLSPVFTTPEDLAGWMASPEYSWGSSRTNRPTYEQALKFVGVGWAPTGGTLKGSVLDGVALVAEMDGGR